MINHWTTPGVKMCSVSNVFKSSNIRKHMRDRNLRSHINELSKVCVFLTIKNFFFRNQNTILSMHFIIINYLINTRDYIKISEFVTLTGFLDIETKSEN